MRKTFATMLTMGLAAGVASAQTPGSGVGSGGNNTTTTQRPAGAGGSAGATGAGGQAGATGTGGATSSSGARVGGTQNTGGAGGSSGTANSPGARATGRGTLGGQGTATGAAGSAGAQDLPGRGTRGTAAGVGTDTTRAGGAADDAAAQINTDMLFAAAAAAGGMAEVGTSRVALEKGGSDEIKQFARQMIDDHTRANRELLALATQKGMQPPRGLDIKDQADLAMLASLSGEEFDKAYATQQLAAHICAVNQFTAEASIGRDPELKAWAAKTLPALKEHKMMVQKMVDRFEKSEQPDAPRNP